METVLGKTEFIITEYTADQVVIKNKDIRYIPMFKYQGQPWTFAIPVKSAYLMNIADSKEMLADIIKGDEKHGRVAEYQVARIVDTKLKVGDLREGGFCRIDTLNKSNGEVKILIKALGTALVPAGQKGSVMLYNSAPLIEGFDLVVKHGADAVRAIKAAGLK